MEAAVPFVQVDEQGQFTVCEEALQVLSTVSSPLCVIACVGTYRTGKSFLLNALAGDHRKGFDIGPSVKPCTKGIWLRLTNREENGSRVVILDTEGTGSTDKDASYDSRVFSLAVLLSSHLMFNSTGAIDEKSLQELSLVANLTKCIHLRSGQSGEDDGAEFHKFFPAFTWVVRDFVLELEQGQTPQQYLEQALAEQSGFSDSVAAKNRIRSMIKGFFQDRGCITLVRPLSEEGKLQKIWELPPSDLRPEFVSGLQTLEGRLFNPARPKSVEGVHVSGAMLGDLTKLYAEAINSGAAPAVLSAWEAVSAMQMQRAKENALLQFESSLNSWLQEKPLPQSSEDLTAIIDSAQQDAVGKFESESVGGGSSDRKMLLGSLGSRIRDLQKENERCSHSAAVNALTNGWKPKGQDFAADAENAQCIDAPILHLRELLSTYVTESSPQAIKGPSVLGAAVSFVEDVTQEIAAFARVSSKCNANRIEKLSADVITIEEKLNEANSNYRQARDEHKSELANLESRLKAEEARRKEDNESHKASLDDLREEKSQLAIQIATLMEQNTAKDAAIQDLRSELLESKAECTRVQSEIAATQEKLNAEREAHESSKSQAREAKSDHEETVRNLKSDFLESKDSFKSEIKELKEELQSSKAEASQSEKSLRDLLDSHQQEAIGMKVELQGSKAVIADLQVKLQEANDVKEKAVASSQQTEDRLQGLIDKAKDEAAISRHSKDKALKKADDAHRTMESMQAELQKLRDVSSVQAQEISTLKENLHEAIISQTQAENLLNEEKRRGEEMTATGADLVTELSRVRLAYESNIMDQHSTMNSTVSESPSPSKLSPSKLLARGNGVDMEDRVKRVKIIANQATEALRNKELAMDALNQDRKAAVARAERNWSRVQELEKSLFRLQKLSGIKLKDMVSGSSDNDSSKQSADLSSSESANEAPVTPIPEKPKPADKTDAQLPITASKVDETPSVDLNSSTNAEDSVTVSSDDESEDGSRNGKSAKLASDDETDDEPAQKQQNTNLTDDEETDAALDSAARGDMETSTDSSAGSETPDATSSSKTANGSSSSTSTFIDFSGKKPALASLAEEEESSSERPDASSPPVGPGKDPSYKGPAMV